MLIKPDKLKEISNCTEEIILIQLIREIVKEIVALEPNMEKYDIDKQQISDMAQILHYLRNPDTLPEFIKL